MLMDQKLVDLFQQQIKNEFESAYIYLGMAAYFDASPYAGFASWMHLQFHEEMEHGMRFFKYLSERGHHVELFPIPTATTHYNSPLEAFKAALGHEQLVTRLINEMYRVAVELKDYAAQIELEWFIKEQVEEEEQTQHIVDQLTLVRDNVAAALAIDRIAGKRKE